MIWVVLSVHNCPPHSFAPKVAPLISRRCASTCPCICGQTVSPIITAGRQVLKPWGRMEKCPRARRSCLGRFSPRPRDNLPQRGRGWWVFKLLVLPDNCRLHCDCRTSDNPAGGSRPLEQVVRRGEERRLEASRGTSRGTTN